MGVYHITYITKLKEVCLYFDGGCNFSCHGCISKYHPQNCHLTEAQKLGKNRTLTRKEVVSCLKHLSLKFKRIVFLGWEPTLDADFLPLTRILKKQFLAYNILITNARGYIRNGLIDEVCISIKAISKKLFKDFTGKNNPVRVLKNFKRYVNNPILKVRAESVFIPDYIDNDEIGKIARFIASVNPLIPYRIDGYIPTDKDSFRRPSEGEMKEAKKIAQKYLKNVSILHSGIKLKHKVKRIY